MKKHYAASGIFSFAFFISHAFRGIELWCHGLARLPEVMETLGFSVFMNGVQHGLQAHLGGDGSEPIEICIGMIDSPLTRAFFPAKMRGCVRELGAWMGICTFFFDMALWRSGWRGLRCVSQWAFAGVSSRSYIRADRSWIGLINGVCAFEGGGIDTD